MTWYIDAEAVSVIAAFGLLLVLGLIMSCLNPAKLITDYAHSFEAL